MPQRRRAADPREVRHSLRAQLPPILIARRTATDGVPSEITAARRAAQRVARVLHLDAEAHLRRATEALPDPKTWAAEERAAARANADAAAPPDAAGAATAPTPPASHDHASAACCRSRPRPAPQRPGRHSPPAPAAPAGATSPPLPPSARPGPIADPAPRSIYTSASASDTPQRTACARSDRLRPAPPPSAPPPLRIRRSAMSTDHPTHPGRFVAVAATLVSAPRLVLAFLTGDGVALPPAVRIALLAASSIATAVAVTGGAAYLAHAMVTAQTGRRTLGAIWLAALLCSSALMAPLLVAGLPHSPLAGTLDSPASRWAWALCAVLAVDLVAAGAMRAGAAERRDRESLEQEHQRAIAALIEQRDHARAQALPAQRRPKPPAAPPAPPPPPSEAPRAAALAAEPPSDRPPLQEHTATERRATSNTPPPATGAQPALHCACVRAFAAQQALAGHRRWCRAAAAGSAQPGPAADRRSAPSSGDAPFPPATRAASHDPAAPVAHGA